MKAELAYQSENLLGEGIVWSARHEEVMWTDILGRHLWRFAPATGQAQSVTLEKRLCCFVPLAGSRLIAGFDDGLYDVDWAAGSSRLIAAIEPDQPTTRLNDGKLDRQGRLIFGTMDEAADGPKPLGHVWRCDGRTPPHALFPHVKISNSICFSPDGRIMYFADTPNRMIEMFDYDPLTGAVENRRVFARVGDEGGWPDGSTVDRDGFLWNAEWDGGRVVRYDPNGKIERIISLPVPLVTCCAFGGRDLDMLYITTARVGLDEAALRRAPLSGSLFRYDAGVRGLADTELNMVM